LRVNNGPTAHWARTCNMHNTSRYWAEKLRQEGQISFEMAKIEGR